MSKWYRTQMISHTYKHTQSASERMESRALPMMRG